MGSGEYGGNGSIHWKVIHGNGRVVNAIGKAGADGIDDDPRDDTGPAGGGRFRVIVEDVDSNDYEYNAVSRTLSVSVPIRHGQRYTRQVTVRWP